MSIDAPVLEVERFGPKSGGAPKKLVILLHGVGSNREDLISLAPYWAPALPDAEFVSPDALEPFDMAPYGRQWFSLQSFEPAFMAAGAAAAGPKLNAWIDGQRDARGLTDADVALVGFSQGSMMAMHCALRRPNPVACVLGYSGRLVEVDDLAPKVQSRPPMLLVHGVMDPVVPFASLEISENLLKSVDVPVRTMGRPRLGHSIDEVGLQAGADFLLAHLQN